jgi:hypothetical protein
VTLIHQHHLEVAFARRAIRANLRLRHVFPGCARRNAFIRQTFGFVVNERTQQALPDPGAGSVFGGLRYRGGSLRNRARELQNALEVWENEGGIVLASTARSAETD